MNKKIGFWSLLSFVTGSMIGSGIFLLPSSISKYGSISILSWIITGSGAFCLAIIFSKLSEYFLNFEHGGPYIYVYKILGKFFGFFVAYVYWISLCIGNAAIALSFSAYLSFFFPVLGSNKIYIFTTSIFIIWIISIFNCMAIKNSGILQIILTILKFIPLIIIGLIGIFYIHPSFILKNFNTKNNIYSNISTIIKCSSLSLWAFIGLETATITFKEVENPKINIPKATLFGILIAVAIYMLNTITIIGIINPKNLFLSKAPFAEASKIIFGNFGGKIVAFIAIISTIGSLNSWIMLQGRVPYSASAVDLFPKFFLIKNKNNIPYVSLIFSSLIITIFLCMTLNENLIKEFTFIISLSIFSTLIPYIMCIISFIIINIKKKHISYKNILIALFALFYSFSMIISLDKKIILYGFFITLIGFFIGYIILNNNKKNNLII